MTEVRPVLTFDHLPAGGDRLLTETEAAHMLGLQPQTLRKFRSSGAPHQPPYVHLGRSVRYKLSDLLSFMSGLTTERAAA